jgi:hypothetical protein
MASSAKVAGKARSVPSYKTGGRQPVKKSFDWKGLFVVGGGIAAIALLAFGGGYALKHSGGGLPVVEAPDGPVRVKPDQTGGAATIGGDFDTGEGKAEGLAPATENPDIDALHQKFTPQPPAAASASEVATLVARLPPLVSTAIAETAPAAATQIAAPVRASTVMADSGIAVQLAALDSPQAGQSAWSEIIARNADLLAGRNHLLMPATIAGHQIWRLRVSGFADVADAANFCVKLRSRGADCTVAAF